MTLITALACYQEALPEIDIVGTVVVPRAAVTRTVANYAEDGSVTGSEEVVDSRFMGPVFLGAYSGVESNSFGYPHPALGPVFDGEGNTFPYGGTSVGRYDFGCYGSLACKIVTGRFTDYNDTLDYFRMIGNPVEDNDGLEVLYGSTFQQRCYDYYDATSDLEVSFIGDEDFTENANGDFEAEFYMPHTLYVEGMVIWGLMDAPIIDTQSTTSNGTFTTCATDSSRPVSEYSSDFKEGEQVADALNYPSRSLTLGDWVADGLAVMNDPEASMTVSLNVKVGD